MNVTNKFCISIMLHMTLACPSIFAMHQAFTRLHDISIDSTIITQKKHRISTNWLHNHRGTLIMAPFSYLSTVICTRLVYRAFEANDIDEKVFSLGIAVPVITTLVGIHTMLYCKEKKRAQQIQHHIEL